MSNSLRSMLAMIELEFRRIRHDRTELFARVIQPILWLVIYGPIMSAVRAIPTGGVPYTDYITPGLLIQSTTFVAIFYGITLVFERESGILKKLLVAPPSRYAIVIGRSMSAGVRAIFQALILVPVALLIGVKFIPNPAYFVSALLLLSLSAAGFAALSLSIACFLKTRERMMGIGQALTMPLFFASNALYPVSLMPQILQEFSIVNPLSHIVGAVRALMITGDLANLPFDLLAIALFDVVMFAVASISFRRIIE